MLNKGIKTLTTVNNWNVTASIARCPLFRIDSPNEIIFFFAQLTFNETDWTRPKKYFYIRCNQLGGTHMRPLIKKVNTKINCYPHPHTRARAFVAVSSLKCKCFHRIKFTCDQTNRTLFKICDSWNEIAYWLWRAQQTGKLYFFWIAFPLFRFWSVENRLLLIVLCAIIALSCVWERKFCFIIAL